MDAVWEKVFKPLVDYRAFSYVDNGGRELVNDERLKGIYFTGGALAAKAIMASTETEFVSECGGNHPCSDFLFIEGVEEDGFAVNNEAFCQIMSEVALDTPAEAEALLQKAVEFSNNNLMGTSGACILVDEDTLKTHRGAVEQAVTDLEYGGIAVNDMPPPSGSTPGLPGAAMKRAKSSSQAVVTLATC